MKLDQADMIIMRKFAGIPMIMKIERKIILVRSTFPSSTQGFSKPKSSSKFRYSSSTISAGSSGLIGSYFYRKVNN